MGPRAGGAALQRPGRGGEALAAVGHRHVGGGRLEDLLEAEAAAEAAGPAPRPSRSPAPPGKPRAPPEPFQRRIRGIRRGKFISTDSTGMFMQLETSVSMTSMPSLSGWAPMHPAGPSRA